MLLSLGFQKKQRRENHLWYRLTVNESVEALFGDDKLTVERVGRVVLRRTTSDNSTISDQERFTALGDGLKDADRWYLNLEKLAFLDIESTGLNIGAGNIAFLIGVGFFRQGRWILIQFFLENFIQEEVILEIFLRIIGRFKTLVSFNGRRFDIPVLQNRASFHVLNASILEEIPHLDLYPICRRLYRGLSMSFSLQSLETYLFQKRRVDDIPGAEIPLSYFAFQNRGDTSALTKTLNHHSQDIFSLGRIYVRVFQDILLKEDMQLLGNFYFVTVAQKNWPLADCLRETVEKNFFRENVLSSKSGKQNKHYIDTKQIDDKNTVFTKDMRNDPATSRHILQALILHLRRHRQWEKLCSLWQKYSNIYPEFNLELSKYYEHRKKDFDSALNYLSEYKKQFLEYKRKERDPKKEKLFKLRYRRLQRKKAAL